MRLLVVTAVIALGCSSKLYIQSVRYPGTGDVTEQPGCNARLLVEDAPLANECALIGDVFIGDTGFSMNCGIERVRAELRTAACRLGGDTVRIRRLKDVHSNCAQARAMVYRCASDDAPD